MGYIAFFYQAQYNYDISHKGEVEMSACTFFGHHDCPSSIGQNLYDVLVELIENHSVEIFYVAHQGAFNALVRSVLKELKIIYPHIIYAVVLDRFPLEKDRLKDKDYSDAILPDGIEDIQPRYAIAWRNRWMLKQSDYVVTYITHAKGNAAKFAAMAQKQKKTLYNLYL
jgi:hypothetical protein